jgi:hypothetical protein
MAGGILLMVSHLYRSKKVYNLALLNIILILIIVSLLGRRGAVLSTVCILAFLIIIRFQSTVISKTKKYAYSTLIFLFIPLSYVSYSFLEKNVYALQRGGWQESRGAIFNDFFNDFSSQTDWIVGRGLNGTVVGTIRSETLIRSVIENGYLTVVLKGGLLYLIPMLLLFINASYLGFLKTRNDLTKALAATIIIQLVSMATFGVPETSTEYLMVWICVSACYSGHLRSLTNTDIIKILN